jgi:hypothetical protein
MTRNEDLLRIVENLAQEARRTEGLAQHRRLLRTIGQIKGCLDKVTTQTRDPMTLKEEKIPS